MNPRKPTALKLIQGTTRADRSNPNEAQPEIDIPQVPEHLSDEAKVEWGRISQELAQVGLLSRIDRAALSMYCQAWARWVKAEKRMKRDAEITGDGEIIKAPSGYLIQSPWWSIANKAMEQAHKFLQGFGMDPASRTRIHAQPATGNASKKKDKNYA